MRISIAHLLLAAALISPLSGRAEAGAWTLPKGQNWLKVGFMFQDTTDRYFLDGERIPYFFDGRNRTRALFFEYARGLTDRWDVKAQLPVFSISFDDLAADRTSNGLGDLRLETRFNAVRHPLVITVGGTVKFPTGEFVNDAEIVPVGEGQYDVDSFAELGRSLWPVRGYATGKIGYRWRTTNAETGIDFGNELIWQAELGFRPWSRVDVKFLFRGLHGAESSSFGLTIETLKREALYVEPGLTFALKPNQGIELTVPISVGGRNWPAGPLLNLSFNWLF